MTKPRMDLKRLGVAVLLCIHFFWLRGEASEPSSIASVDATFDVTLSGSAAYTIPIRISPGTTGTEPKVALVYDSQSKGGPIGASWGLSGLSKITRGPTTLYTDGKIRGVQLDDSDALYLDGARLIEVGASEVAGVKRTEYRKMSDDESRIYRFGIEYDKSSFVVETKGGMRLIFDSSNNSSLRLKNGQILLYAVSRALDTANNSIEYQYVVGEQGNHDISRIEYTGRGRLDDVGRFVQERKGFAAVEFSYTEATRAYEYYIAGQRLQASRLLGGIRATVTSDINAPAAAWLQVSRYKLTYQEKETSSNRYILTTVSQFGEKDSEILPTRFEYSDPKVGWEKDKFSLPGEISFAAEKIVGRALRFGRLTAGQAAPDILVSLQANGKLESFAFANKGKGEWKRLDEDNKLIKPPVPFSNTDGDDLGVLLLDLNGDGRDDLIQANQTATGEFQSSAYLLKDDKWQANENYRLPFPIASGGRRTVSVLAGECRAKGKVDLVCQQNGAWRFLENSGTGWKPSVSLESQLPANAYVVLFDVDGDGLMEIVAHAVIDGQPRWKILRLTNGGWVPEERAAFDLAQFVPASVNPRALLPLKLTGFSSDSLVIGDASTGFYKALTPTTTGWREVPEKKPIFDVVNAAGASVFPVAIDVDGDKRVDVIANHRPVGSQATVYAILQEDGRWVKSQVFEPKAEIAGEAAERLESFIGDLDGDGYPEIVVINKNSTGLELVERGSANGFVTTPNYGPPIPFASDDRQDRGVRLVDLNGDGLPDLIFRRSSSDDSPTSTNKGAYINTGKGWIKAPGLVPVVDFASDQITGNPVQFVDVDGDGYIDLLYHYKKADGTVIRAYYRNTACDPSNAQDAAAHDNSRPWDPRIDRKWVLQEKSPGVPSDYAPPEGFPFSEQGIGDTGVRIIDVNGDGRADILYGQLPAKGGGNAENTVEVCTEEKGVKVCRLNRSLFRTAAFLNTGSGWKESKDYAPLVPFMYIDPAQGGRAVDLFVQLVDVNNDGLPDIVASFQHPYSSKYVVAEVSLNNGNGWTIADNIALPTLANGERLLLDSALRDRRTSIQWSDLNGDGLQDIVLTKRNGAANESVTFISTGRGFQASTSGLQIPLKAIGEKEGDPGLRLIDLNGDGLPDLIYSRQLDSGAIEAGVFLNNGARWIEAGGGVPAGLPAFVDNQGRDNGIRLFDVDGNGLPDILQAYAAAAQNARSFSNVYLNTARKADVLEKIDNGLGSVVTLAYQSAQEPFPKPVASEPQMVAPWQRVYLPEEGSSRELISAAPPFYLVRRVVKSHRGAEPLTFSYRYGGYKIHASALKPMGFAWRESLNEAQESQMIVRAEMSQDVRLRHNLVRESSSWMPLDVVQPLHAQRVRDGLADWSNLTTPSPADNPAGIKLVTDTTYQWRPRETTIGPTRISQALLDSSHTESYELDGTIIKRETTSLSYATPSSPLDFSLNVSKCSVVRGDGTSIVSRHTYREDSQRWFLGRVVESEFTRTGDFDPLTKSRVQEVQKCRFEYDLATGLIVGETANAHSEDGWRYTQFTRDEFGNITAEKLSSRFDRPRASETVFDQLGRFVVTRRNAYGHATSYTRKVETGAILTQTDPNRLVSSFRYDEFGRLAVALSPEGIADERSYLWPSSIEILTSDLKGAAYVLQTRVGTLPPAYSIIDTRGLEVRKVTIGYSSDPSEVRYIKQDFVFDPLGRRVSSSLPYEGAQPRFWKKVDLDQLGRVKRVTEANGSFVSSSYSTRPEGGVVASSEDWRGYKSKVIRNVRGLPVESHDAKGSTTRFQYDAADRLARMDGVNGAVTIHHYDECGRRIQTRDPDMGVWNYRYDAFGNLTSQIDSKAQRVTFEYDLLGRAVRNARNDSVYTWDYDTAFQGIGKLTRTTSSDGYKEEYFYDKFGRNNRVAVTIDGESHTTSTDFDALSRPYRISYPDGLSVENIFDRNGFWTAVVNPDSQTRLWEAVDINVFGQVCSERYGNGIPVVKTYDERTARLVKLSSGDEKARSVLDLDLAYDLAGNTISRRVQNGASFDAAPTETFRYDELDRLSEVKVNGKSRARYEFDLAGRFTSKSDLGRYHYLAAEAESGASDAMEGHPFHGVKYITNNGQKKRFHYDRNGNLLHAYGIDYEYTSDDKVKKYSLSNLKWSHFDYAPGGRRYRQLHFDGGERTETLYLGAYERHTSYRAGGEKNWANRHYVSNPEGVFAILETYGSGTRAKLACNYLHKDHQDNILVVSDARGVILDGYSYNPWGAQTQYRDKAGKEKPSHTRRGFSAHEHLAGAPLIHMNGRVYNSSIAVFTSVDPINQFAGDSQTANGYQYARNNPLRYVDKTGYGLFDPVGDFIRGVGNAAGAALGWLGDRLGEAWTWVKDNWREIVIITATVVAGAIASPLGPVAAGAIAGAVQGGLSAALYGGSVTDVISGAIRGAVIGAMFGAVAKGVQTGALNPYVGAAFAAHINGVSTAFGGGDYWTGVKIGLITAGISQIAPARHATNWEAAARISTAAVVGGTISEMNGGKFANGAIMGAFQACVSEVARMHAERKARAMEQGEKDLISEKGNKIKGMTTKGVNIIKGRWTLFQDSRTAMTPDGNAYFPEEIYREDFSAGNDSSAAVRANKGLFLHEVTHVWQRQNGMNVIGEAIKLWITPGSYNSNYLSPDSTPFSELNFEAQGDRVSKDAGYPR